MKKLVLIVFVGLVACDPEAVSVDPVVDPDPTATPDPIDDPDPTDPTDPTNPVDYPDAVTDVLDLPSTPFDYSTTWPAHFDAGFVAAVDNTPASNPTTDAGATLGRVLFYDVELSANRTVACASCHLQADGFSDPFALSEGFEGLLTGRNSMGLANSALYRNGAAFWDERAATLEEQALMPIQDPIEMGLTLDELVDRVEAAAYYPALFTQAFGDDTVDTDRIADALAQFVRSITSTSTPFDAGLAATGDVRDPFPGFTPQENRGKQLFFGPQGNCAVCHVAQIGPPGPGGPGAANQAVFFMDRARHNGLDATTTDEGLGAVTGNPQDDGKFKSPTLRNVALTAPYMHDGRLDTLEDVIDHYDSGVQDHPNLDPRLRRGPGNQPQRLNLSNNDKAALVAFLETLTDAALQTDPRFSDPFRE